MKNRYEGKVRIDSEKKSISVSLKMDYIVKGEAVSNIKFYLPSETSNIQVISESIENINVKNVAGWSQLIYGDTHLELHFNKTFNAGDTIPLIFEYSSDLSNIPDTGMNMFSEDLIEIGVYTPWFPLTEDFQESIFHVTVDIDDEYILVGGNVGKENGLWILDQKDPYVCCTIIASRSFKNNCYSNSLGNIRTNVYWVNEENKESCKEIDESIKEIMNFYVQSFGHIDGEKIDVVMVPRAESESSGGYCRPGLIVLPGKQAKNMHYKYKSKDDDYMFKYLAHELAHMWWNKADVTSWENWLNESFAEYSSLMAIRELRNKERFNQSIELNKTKSIDLGPIRNCTFKDKDYFDIWYVKGPTILSYLENQVGESRFKNLCKTIHCEGLIKTDAVVNRIKEIEGEDIGDFLDVLISK